VQSLARPIKEEDLDVDVVVVVAVEAKEEETTVVDVVEGVEDEVVEEADQKRKMRLVVGSQ